MKFCINSGIILVILLSLVASAGISAGDIPPISVQNVHATISADFSADKQEGNVPLNVNFTDLSTGLHDHFEWSFGDGEFSSEQNPVHLFQKPGVYTVSLSVTGSAGSDKKTRIGYITAHDEPAMADLSITDPPECALDDISSLSMQHGDISEIGGQESAIESHEFIESEESDDSDVAGTKQINTVPVPEEAPVQADFSVTGSTGVVPFKVSFEDLSTGPVTDWLWDFGDGTTSAAPSPIHIYQTEGTYDITLVVKGDESQDSVSKSGIIQVTPPTIAAFTAEPDEGTAPLQVRFTDQSSGDIIKREWKFGDGIFSEMDSPTHVYEVPGTYDVSLTVTGISDEDIMTRPSYIVVLPDNPPPSPAPASVPVTTPENTPSFSNAPDPVLPEPVDDTLPELTDGESTTIIPEPEPEEIYPDNEIESLPSETSDQPELMIKAESSQPTPPTVNFDFSPVTGLAPLKVQFSDMSTGEYETATWDFGDGTNSTEPDPVHIYEKPGEFLVTLTINNPESEDTFSFSRTIQVTSPPEPPVADFTVSSTKGTVPLAIVCTDNSKGEISDWIWDFGDGKVIRGKNPTHTYVLPGQYPITLTVKGPGGKDEIRKNSIITVLQSPPGPEALFDADPVHGIVPLSVSFQDKSTGTVTGWSWDFGDGITSSEQNPVHEYINPGVYDVTLTMTGTDGKSVLLKESYITVEKAPKPVKAGFSASPTSGDAALTVAFSDKTTGDADAWNWSFGDGGMSDKQNPNHTYTKPGIYTVRLESSGPGGRDIIEKADKITVLATQISPEVRITAEPANGTAPLTVSFNQLNTGEGLRSTWTFGEGNSSNEKSPVHTYTMPGLYNVTLTLQDAQGQTRTITKNEFVNVTRPVIPPVAGFTCNETEGNAPFTIKFTDQSSGEVDQWAWSFGDGISANSQSPVHTYNASGSYKVTLNVKGPGGEDSYTINQSITVKDVIPTIPDSEPEEESPVDTEEEELIEQPVQEQKADNITEKYQETESFIPEIIVSGNSGNAPLLVDFSSTWADKGGTFHWKFGDGFTSSEPEVSHTYEKPGVYSVSLVREFEGLTQEIISKDLIRVNETIQIPIASFNAEPVAGPAPLQVTFQSRSSGDISETTWDFGDQTQDIGETVKHVYSRPGTYTVSLQVQGPGGSSTEVQQELITVGSSSSNPPQARFRTDKRTGYVPLKVQFTDQSLGKVSDWRWDFGDGTSSTERNPSHEFNETGIFSISLSVSGPGGENQVSRKGYVVVSPSPNPLIAGFTMEPSEGIAPLSVKFIDSSTGNINRYLWDFGDGAVTETRNPTHRYTKPGSYIVKLTVYGPTGISSADQSVTVGPFLARTKLQDGNLQQFRTPDRRTGIADTDDVKISELSKPYADFIINKKSGRAPLTVNFEDLSTGTIESWSWNFGDNSYSIEQNPVHTYVKPGTYSITLTVKGPYGISNKKIRDAVSIT